MIIQFFSDIHLEFGPLEMQVNPVTDVIVAAGDIGLGTSGIDWLLSAQRPVVYIAGNHEFYHGDFISTRKEIAAATANTPIHFLDNRAVVIDGVRFVGTTLWTDFNNGKPKLMKLAQFQMNDYQQITHQRTTQLSPQHTFEANHIAVNWLVEILSEPFDGKTVVVSHHAPTKYSWPGDHNDTFLYSYCNTLDALLRKYFIEIWIHGHIHHAADYLVHGKRILCNPRGYARLQNVIGFDLTKTVEI